MPFHSSSFYLHPPGHSPSGQDTADANLQKLTQLVNKESNLIEKVTFTSVSNLPASLRVLAYRYTCNCTMDILV